MPPAKKAAPARRKPRTFGSVEQLPSGRYRARYWGPDGIQYTAKTTARRALTFETRGDADAYLSGQRADISRGTWKTPDAPTPVAAAPAPLTLAVYTVPWLADRPLALRTREEYDRLLRLRILPTFGSSGLAEITSVAVRSWYAAQANTPTARAQAYALLRSILATAVDDEILMRNPCRIRGAGVSRAAKPRKPATAAELAVIVEAMPPPLRMLVLLACWCSLRFGEVTELRRGDVDLEHGVLRIRRAVVTTPTAGSVVKEPKSRAGIRDVVIPPHILDALAAHLDEHTQPGKVALLFASDNGGHLANSSMHWVYRPACKAAGRSDLSFHDLRHTGQTLAAASGANLRELMNRAGQSSPGAALRYLHAVDGADRAIAERMSARAAEAGRGESDLPGRR